MLVTLVAVLCNSQLCLEKVVTTSDQSGITMSACAVNAQIGIADWLAKGPYREWHLQRYKCVLGKYTPKKAKRRSAAHLQRRLSSSRAGISVQVRGHATTLSYSAHAEYPVFRGLSTSLRAQRSNPFFLSCRAMDCFAALAMTPEAFET